MDGCQEVSWILEGPRIVSDRGKDCPRHPHRPQMGCVHSMCNSISMRRDRLTGNLVCGGRCRAPGSLVSICVQGMYILVHASFGRGDGQEANSEVRDGKVDKTTGAPLGTPSHPPSMASQLAAPPPRIMTWIRCGPGSPGKSPRWRSSRRSLSPSAGEAITRRPPSLLVLWRCEPVDN